MELLTPKHVEQVLSELGVQTHIEQFEVSTGTSQQAADAIGCELGQIVKSLAFIIEGRPILVLASGDQRVDDRKLAALLNVGRKKVKTASAEECITLYGYAPGGVPPVGHRTLALPCYIDDSLQRYTLLYAAGGSANTIFAITLTELCRITSGTLADVRREEPQEG